MQQNIQKIAIIDYGSPLAHLLATDIRRLNVYSEIVDPSIPIERLKQYKGIIIADKSANYSHENILPFNPEILDLNLPILAIAYGQSLIVSALGGKIEYTTQDLQHDSHNLTVLDSSTILEGLSTQNTTQVWKTTNHKITSLPSQMQVLATTQQDPHAVVVYPQKNIFTVNFQLGITATEKGQSILKNFLNTCQVDYSWDLQGFLEDKIQEIKNRVQDKKVFLMISGGVDSTVSFALLSKAIGTDNVYGLFVDTGFLRSNEVQEVTEALQNIGVKNLHVYDGASQYFSALKEVYDPETKRNIIGDLFLDIQAQVSADLNLNPDEWLLGQGTIYPDTIESGGTKHSQKIKTHHNRVPRIQELINQNKIIEPVADLYKDEVRQIGRLLGLPDHMVDRHPFPGPGLAIRILGQENDLSESQKQHITTETQTINQFIQSEYPNLNITAHVLASKSVGMQDTGRTYKHPLALEADELLQSHDFNTLLNLSKKLTQTFTSINRVILKISDSGLTSPSLPIQNANLVTNSYPSPQRVQALQQVDAIFTKHLKSSGEYNQAWQAPLVLLPISIQTNSTKNNYESCVLRPISSREAMTADVFVLQQPTIQTFLNDLKTSKSPISAVFYDLTNKPPATIEWE